MTREGPLTEKVKGQRKSNQSQHRNGWTSRFVLCRNIIMWYFIDPCKEMLHFHAPLSAGRPEQRARRGQGGNDPLRNTLAGQIISSRGAALRARLTEGWSLTEREVNLAKWWGGTSVDTCCRGKAKHLQDGSDGPTWHHKYVCTYSTYRFPTENPKQQSIYICLKQILYK